MQVIMLVMEDLYSGSYEVVVQWEELEVQIQANVAANSVDAEDKDD